MRTALFLIALAISDNAGSDFEGSNVILLILFMVFFTMDILELIK